MTVIAIMAGLLPILWNTGAGSEVMQRIATPMIGGMVSSTVLTLLVIPAIYGLVKGWGLPEAAGLSGQHPADGGSKSGTAASSPIVSEPVQ
jgi:Cu(I)/Ag(I) efflux system membrane protein CusA/SilA